MSDVKSKKHKKAWPTKAVMQQIYDRNLWGGNSSSFYSGLGSHDPEIVLPYLKVVISFLNTFERPLTVCDLGCGDFNVGKELVKYTKNYVGIDIVPELIARNQEKFKADNLEFRCLDIAKDDLPIADCAILRQVLQHLSNAEIKNIVSKLSCFKYVILTEHIPKGDFIPNSDILSGQGIRLKKKSGVNILEPPFNFKLKNAEQLLSVTSKEFKGAIVTTMYTVF